jgi:hypothetical protein
MDRPSGNVISPLVGNDVGRSTEREIKGDISQLIDEAVAEGLTPEVTEVYGWRLV